MTELGQTERDVEEPQDALLKIVQELADARQERLNAEPETIEEAVLSGRERGLRYAVRQFEQLDEIQKLTHLPEWSIGLENESGDWEWYYPRALTRQTALQKARDEARDDLGDGPLNAYAVEGPHG